MWSRLIYQAGMRSPSMKLITILITDDIAQNRSYILQIISNMALNAQIQEAADGEIALKLVTAQIAKTGANFDLIIMDFKMPGINGQQTTTAIRQLEQAAKLNKQSYIITWSSAMSTPYVGADDWMPKMVDKSDIMRVLHFVYHSHLS